jgi:hydroxypyruvate isomerase
VLLDRSAKKVANELQIAVNTSHQAKRRIEIARFLVLKTHEESSCTGRLHVGNSISLKLKSCFDGFLPFLPPPSNIMLIQTNLSRRKMMMAALTASMAVQMKATTLAAAGLNDKSTGLRHSVCRGPFSKIPMEEFCESCRELGIESIELLEPDDYPVVQKYGLSCAVGRYTTTELPGSHINSGWNRLEHHEVLIRGYEDLIRKTADAGFPKVICFSGVRNGMDEATGLENCAVGLSQLMPLCDRLGVTMVMELLNSKINHADYMGDNTRFGVGLCKKIDHPRFRILYDIYHMQIMEGNLCATIREHHPWFAHYHTAGVPGRHEIDESQEINYPAVVRAILETGYRDFIAQEFSPVRKDKIASLRQAVDICSLKSPVS